ncbi:alpha/beta hydrolase [Marinobacter sediminum]|uniref:alpha/beta fold hydrolase n=1 Tax=Marinobacter sediminum TaxID=256323 RepID=UPI00202F6A16|nr:alpha/beta hydrolase [Marinobacter sediminum]MCM0613800.1 alpha/beta hydrolase [Marinobacter sediminum]
MSEARHEGRQDSRSGVSLEHGWISFLQNGDGVPVLFLHGLNGNGSSWIEQLEGLSSNFRIVAWDAPGYGDSDLAGDSITDLAQVAIQFIAKVSSGPINIVGHSMGGLVAMKVATMAPELVNRLVLSCTHPGHGLAQDTGADNRYRRRLEELKTLSGEEYGRRRAKGMLPEGTSEAVFEKVAGIAAESRAEGVAAAAWAIQTADLREELDQIQASTLVITCDQDRVAPLEKAKPLLQSIPDVRHVELKGLGHAPYLEDARRYNVAITDFLLESS